MERRPRTAPQLSLLLGGGSWILTLLYFIGQAWPRVPGRRRTA